MRCEQQRASTALQDIPDDPDGSFGSGHSGPAVVYVGREAAHAADPGLSSDDPVRCSGPWWRSTTRSCREPGATHVKHR